MMIIMILLSIIYIYIYYNIIYARGGGGGHLSRVGGSRRAGSHGTIDFRNFIVFFLAETLAH